jgi:hypothetical protein
VGLIPFFLGEVTHDPRIKALDFHCPSRRTIDAPRLCTWPDLMEKVVHGQPPLMFVA